MSSAATATSAATTAGSGAGEGAEEAAKDSADIAAFFRSGECGPVLGEQGGRAGGKTAAGGRSERWPWGSDFFPWEPGKETRAGGFVRWPRGRLACLSPSRHCPSVPWGSGGEESRAPPVPCRGQRGLGRATRGRDATLIGRTEA